MIDVQSPYLPLYTDKEKFIILITGGRGSGKSFNASTFIERLTFEKGHVILFCRYTMTSAGLSVIPEFGDKIERDGTAKYFEVTKTDITNSLSGSRVMFRGIKTSSGNQTAKLKSIQGITTFVCDEAEEWTSDTEFETLVLSVRQKDIQNRIIVMMNPTDKNHFIYQKYLKDTHMLVEFDGVPVQISTHPNVLHIHTSYLDNIENLGEQFLKEMEEMKVTNPKKYAHVAMGQWNDRAEGVVYDNWTIIDEFPDYEKGKTGMGIDFGFTQDPTAIVRCLIVDKTLYVDELCYKTHMLTSDIVKELKQFQKMKVIAESADPRLIEEIKRAGFNIHAVDKSSVANVGSILAGINALKEYDIRITSRSKNIIYEMQNYRWDKDKDGQPINKPIDKDNHALDAIRYWVLGEILGKTKKKTTIKSGIFY